MWQRVGMLGIPNELQFRWRMLMFVVSSGLFPRDIHIDESV